jgi:integrase
VASARPAHTAGSLWIAAGVDIKTVSAWLGHPTAKLTLDTYGHLMGRDADRAALERVNRTLGDLKGTSRASECFSANQART